MAKTKTNVANVRKLINQNKSALIGGYNSKGTPEVFEVVKSNKDDIPTAVQKVETVARTLELSVRVCEYPLRGQ